MNLVETLTDPQFLMAALAAISAAAMVFTFGASFFDRSDMKTRIKRVALEREQLRSAELARLRGASEARRDGRGSAEPKAVVSSIVEKFSLKKAFVDEKTQHKLIMAGFRAPGHLTTFVFFRFVTPIGLFFAGAFYLAVLTPGDRPLFLNILYALMIGILGSYLPVVMLVNATKKRQYSIQRAWPDCLDLMLLCVESGMSIEHTIKRVGAEIGVQSTELAEEMALTTAELSFLPERTQAYENLSSRTGLDGVQAVMTALVQSENYGTSVGQALRVMAEEGREMRLMEAEKKAAALPPKMTVPLIVFVLPVLFIVIISPAVLKVFAGN